MLDNRDLRAEQGGVYRSASVGDIVDIVGVDPDQRGLRIYQELRRVGGQERVAFELLVAAPVPIPAGMHQHRLAA